MIPFVLFNYDSKLEVLFYVKNRQYWGDGAWGIGWFVLGQLVGSQKKNQSRLVRIRFWKRTFFLRIELIFLKKIENFKVWLLP